MGEDLREESMKKFDGNSKKLGNPQGPAGFDLGTQEACQPVYPNFMGRL